MRCPHFQKVNFQKIKQVKNQQATVDDQTHEPMTYSIFSIQSLSQDVFNVPQEGIQQVNCLKSKMSNYKYTFNSISAREESIKQCSNIKMPKQMNIKKMIISSSSDIHTSKPSISLASLVGQEDYDFPVKHIIYTKNQQNQQDGEIPSQHQHSSGRKNPHILVSKTSMMTHDTFEIFNGIIFLNQRQESAYQCQLKDYIIKIFCQQKIKYFIELQKVYVSLQLLSQQRGLQLKLKCKNRTQSVCLYFINPFQRQIFKQVYLNCIKKIKQLRKIKKILEHNKQNYHQSNNLYQQSSQQSQILNQKSYLNQDEHAQSISSLSMNSYQGDSLVFETQRMFFNQVKQTGNTFDILLFKNKSLMSKVQRIFTNSDYDHTAMLLKTANNQLLMLQATSNSGVAIYTFNSLLKIDKGKYFSRIGLRRYTGQKNLAKIARLQNFIRKTVGKKYKFDPMYLIKSQANQGKQTYFCSQLVAQALQDAGILSNEYPSFKYLPKHFADYKLNNQIIDGKYSQTIILQ